MGRPASPHPSAAIGFRAFASFRAFAVPCRFGPLRPGRQLFVPLYPLRERGSSIAGGEHEFATGTSRAGAGKGGTALAKQRFYGPPNPEYESDSLWLAAFMERHAGSQEKISHVLGANLPRVWQRGDP